MPDRLMRHGRAVRAQGRMPRFRRGFQLARMVAPVLLLMALAAGAYVLFDDLPSTSAHSHTLTASSGTFQVIDGDTVRFRDERLRLLVIDAPEIRSPRCPAEYQAGIAAKSANGIAGKAGCQPPIAQINKRISNG